MLLAFVFLNVPLSTAHANSEVKRIPLTQEERAWLDENIDQVYLAPTMDYPPMMWNKYGVNFGISYDYIKLMAQSLDVELKEREARPLQEILVATKEGESNIIPILAPTQERLKYLIFTRPYLSAPAVFFTKTGKKNLDAKDIISQKLRVAVAEGYGVEEYLRDRYPEMILVPQQNNYFIVEGVSSGQFDVGVADVLSLVSLTKENNISNIKKSGDTGFEYHFSFAVPSSMVELRNALDDAIEAMPERTVYELQRKWLPDQASTAYLGIQEPGASAEHLTLLNTLVAILSAIVIIIIGFIIRHMLVRHTGQYKPLSPE